MHLTMDMMKGSCSRKMDIGHHHPALTFMECFIFLTDPYLYGEAPLLHVPPHTLQHRKTWHYTEQGLMSYLSSLRQGLDDTCYEVSLTIYDAKC